VSCELTITVLHGYLDGELDAARAADFERHLISCAPCVAALETHEALRSSLQGARLYERAPAVLREKLHAAVGASGRISAAAISQPAEHLFEVRELIVASRGRAQLPILVD